MRIWEWETFWWFIAWCWFVGMAVCLALVSGGAGPGMNLYGLVGVVLLLTFGGATLKWHARRDRANDRTARGHCPTCNYDRAGLPPDAPCPECGGAGEGKSVPGSSANR